MVCKVDLRPFEKRYKAFRDIEELFCSCHLHGYTPLLLLIVCISPGSMDFCGSANQPDPFE